MAEEKATQESISLYDGDRAIIKEVQETFNLNGKSQAVQFIIRNWKNTQDLISRLQMVDVPTTPQQRATQ